MTTLDKSTGIEQTQIYSCLVCGRFHYRDQDQELFLQHEEFQSHYGIWETNETLRQRAERYGITLLSVALL
jgi:hypothetical protein